MAGILDQETCVEVTLFFDDSISVNVHINPISFSFASELLMTPFHHLLSSKVPIHWMDQLQEVFEASKKEIVAQCGRRYAVLTTDCELH